MNIYEKLAAVQQETKAPKDRYNKFGEYYYRSAEGILEAVKPILKKYEAMILITDEMLEVGGRIYVQATVSFKDLKDNNGTIRCTAFAGESAEKKKLDASQLTGIASSYARKYALNGLLLLDDTKDADTDEYQKQTQDKKGSLADDIRELAKKANVTESNICTQAGVDKLEDIDTQTYSKIKAALMAKIHVAQQAKVTEG